MNPQVYRWVTLVLWSVGALGAWVFVTRYGFLARWWRSPIGRNLMAFAVNNALIFSWLVWLRLAPPPRPEWAQWVTLGLTGPLAGIVVWRLVLFEVLQWRGRRGSDGRLGKSDTRA